MNTISLLFCGDYSPMHQYKSLVKDRGHNIFGDLLADIGRADISFLNLEAPVSASSGRVSKSGQRLGVSPQAIRAVADAGFKVVGLANNHIMDHGKEGLEATINQLTHDGLIYCGAGENLKSASSPAIIQLHNNRSVAIIAIAETEFNIAGPSTPGAYPLDAIANAKQIKQAKATADLVLVTVHAGNEYFPYPRPNLRRLCKFLIDCGADGVFCHHPHVPGAYEIYDQRPIIYSLGNLIFDHSNPPPGWNEGYAAAVEYDLDTGDLVKFEPIPYTQSAAQEGLRKKVGSDKESFLSYIESLRKNLEDEASYLKEWNTFCKAKEADVLSRMYSPLLFPGVARLGRWFPFNNLLLPRSAVNRRLNAVRCESHRELLVAVLENRKNAIDGNG